MMDRKEQVLKAVAEFLASRGVDPKEVINTSVIQRAARAGRALSPEEIGINIGRCLYEEIVLEKRRARVETAIVEGMTAARNISEPALLPLPFFLKLRSEKPKEQVFRAAVWSNAAVSYYIETTSTKPPSFKKSSFGMVVQSWGESSDGYRPAGQSEKIGRVERGGLVKEDLSSMIGVEFDADTPLLAATEWFETERVRYAEELALWQADLERYEAEKAEYRRVERENEKALLDWEKSLSPAEVAIHLVRRNECPACEISGRPCEIEGDTSVWNDRLQQHDNLLDSVYSFLRGRGLEL